jgi:hypothetical protein
MPYPKVELNTQQIGALADNGATSTTTEYLDLAAKVASRFKRWQDRANAANIDQTPTHFFDPSVNATSAGTGTYANPFTTQAQLTAWVTSLSGALGGKILGFKRGTVTTEAISLAANGNRSQSFIICPYGTSQNLPQIVIGSVASSWTSISAAPSSGLIYKTTSSVNQDIYQNGARVPKRSQSLSEADLLTNMAAYGPGCCGFATGFMYFYPADNENPNLGQVEMTVGTGLTNSTNTPALTIQTLDTVNAGNIIVTGLVTRLTRGQGSSLHGPTNAEPTYAGGNVHQAYCAAAQHGVDDTAQTQSAAAFSRGGTSDAKRWNYGSVTNCFAAYIMNNAFETSNEDNGLWENNESYQVGGNLWVELFSSNSNNTVRFCKGEGNYFPTLYTNYSSTACWVSSLYSPFGGGTPIDTTGAKNAGNSIYMNFAKDPVLGGLRIDGGTNTVAHHNTFLYTHNRLNSIDGALLRSVNAPASTPNNSASSRFSGSAAQLSFTNGPPQRLER